MGIGEVLFMMVVIGFPMSVAAFLGFLMYRFKLRQSQGIREPELRDLIQRMEAMQSELLSLRDDVGELAERADFMERLLSSGSGSSAAEQPDHRSD